LKKGFVPRNEKVYPLSRKEKKEVRKFIQEQTRKKYMAIKVTTDCTDILCEKKNGKKKMV